MWTYLARPRLHRGKVLRQLFLDCFVPLLTVVARARLLLEVGQFATRWHIAEDYDLFLRCAERTEVDYVDEVLAGYRVHRGNLSRGLRQTAARGAGGVSRLPGAKSWPKTRAWGYRHQVAHGRPPLRIRTCIAVSRPSPGRPGLFWAPDVGTISCCTAALDGRPTRPEVCDWRAARIPPGPRKHERPEESSAVRTQSRVRIAVIGPYGLPASYGGIERHAEEIYSRLVGLGHEVTLYSRSSYSEFSRIHRGIRVVRVPVLRVAGWESVFYALGATLHALATGKYDVFHYHSLPSSSYAWLPRLARKRVLSTVHSIDWKHARAGVVWPAGLSVGVNTLP